MALLKAPAVSAVKEVVAMPMQLHFVHLHLKLFLNYHLK
jgi:hypothetical protein